MKANRFFKALIPAAIAAAVCGCESYEIDMPANPEPPVQGPEVSKTVIYQANPRFFASNGCLDALTAQIGRISAMGCDVLWVMPVCEPGEERAVGSPYCIRDFKAVNSRYGTMADFKELVDAAHAAGMKVMLDWIANHTAWDHAWITEHPDWYVKDANGNIVQASTWTDVAQLDYSNDGLRQAMVDAMMYWVEQGNIDGFRCDYAEGVPHDFWADLIAKVRAVRPEFTMLAESSDAAFYADGFDMIYDWNFAPTMSDTFTGGKPADLFAAASGSWSNVPEGKSILRYALNHDVAAENNVATMYGSADALPGAYVLAAMLHGTPMIYSSMDSETRSGKLSFFDYNPLQWSEEMSNVYKAINSAFKASADVRRGELRTYADKKVAVFTRSIPGHDLLVMVNTTGDVCTVKTPISLAGVKMTDLIKGGESAMPVAVEIQPYGYAVYMN